MFRILVTYVGYAKYYSPVISISENTRTYDAGTLPLESGHQLKNLVIVAEKPFMEHQLDRTVYNIESSIISAGNNALEILKKLPGVNVDNSDGITIRGKSGVLIMMDGKTTYMSVQDVANYLKSLDASQIEKIEIITNPSAKYDASGNAIINIILKKDKNMGFNAQVTGTLRQSVYSGAGTGFNANYRTRHFNFFGSYNLGDGTNATYWEQENQYSVPGKPVNLISDRSYSATTGVYHNGRLGMDYSIDKRQTIGVAGECFIGNTNMRTATSTNIYNGGSSPDSTLSRVGNNHSLMQRFTGNLNYTFKIDSLGRELSANADVVSFNSTLLETDVTDYGYASPLLQQSPSTLKFSFPSQLSIMAAKLDYVQPLGKNTKLETGIKGSQVSSDNPSQYWNVIQGVDVNDAGKTNHFIYNENIFAGYINFSRKFSERVDAQLGLRAENTQGHGTQTLTDSSVKQNYLNLFPSAFLSWRMDSFNTLNFSYSRRIDRPDYGSLNPFPVYLSQYNYSMGNPLLVPQIGDNVELTHVYKNILTTSLGYLYMVNVFSENIHQDDITHITYHTTDNLSNYQAYNLLVSLTLHPTRWWTIMPAVNGFHDHYYGIFQGSNYTKAGYTVITNINNSFNFKKGWGGEVTFFYRSENINSTVVNDPFYFVDMGIRKIIAHGKGTLSMNGSDIFWSNRVTATQVFQNVNYHSLNYDDSRRFRITLTWKLGQSQFQREEKRKSAEEELNRVKK